LVGKEIGEVRQNIFVRTSKRKTRAFKRRTKREELGRENLSICCRIC